MRFQLAADQSLPDFLDLPWGDPLEAWSSERLVDVVRGISRHVRRRGARSLDRGPTGGSPRPISPPWPSSPTSSAASLEPAEVYHQLLEHRWFRSEELGRCVSMEEAVASYVPGVLVAAPDERLLPLDGG